MNNNFKLNYKEDLLLKDIIISIEKNNTLYLKKVVYKYDISICNELAKKIDKVYVLDTNNIYYDFFEYYVNQFIIKIKKDLKHKYISNQNIKFLENIKNIITIKTNIFFFNPTYYNYDLLYIFLLRLRTDIGNDFGFYKKKYRMYISFLIVHLERYYKKEKMYDRVLRMLDYIQTEITKDLINTF